MGKRDESKDATESLEYISDTKETRKTFKEVHLILADTVNEDEDDILADSNLPLIDSVINGYLIHKRTPREIGTMVHPVTGVSAVLWEVTIEGDDKFEEAHESSAGGGGGNPSSFLFLTGAQVETWDTIEEEELSSYDVDSKLPWRTVNGEPILVYRKITYPVLTIERLEPYPFDYRIIHAYSNRLNSKEFRGAPPEWCLMLPPKAEPYFQEETMFSKVTYRIKFRTQPLVSAGTCIRPDGTPFDRSDLTPFMVQALHQGTLYRPQPGDEPRAWTDANGNPGTVNLRTDGTVETDTGNPVFIVGWTNYITDFNKLGL